MLQQMFTYNMFECLARYSCQADTSIILSEVTIAFFEYWAFLQSSGSVPLLIDLWNIYVIAGASSLAHVFKIIVGIWSGPIALDTIRSYKSFSTPFTVTIRSGTDGILFPVNVRWHSFASPETLQNTD